MTDLILSWDCYDWIYNCYSLLKDLFGYDLIIICEYGNKPIANHPDLCKNAIIAQREHDLNRLGKYFNIKKIINLNYYPYTNNIEKLKTQLFLNCYIHKYNNVYYTYNTILGQILQNLKRSNIILMEPEDYIPKEIKNLMIGE